MGEGGTKRRVRVEPPFAGAASIPSSAPHGAPSPDKGTKAGRLAYAHQFTNPILPGFNPDPSILRVGDDYYIATSTFEWYPGVQIHHSKDLANWELVTRPLTRKTPARHARRPGQLRRLGAVPDP